MDVAEAVCPDCEKLIVGIRPGEKIHEEMITDADAFSTVDLGDGFVILPSSPSEALLDRYLSLLDGKMVETGFRYNSGTNTDWLSVDEIRQLINDHVDELG